MNGEAERQKNISGMTYRFLKSSHKLLYIYIAVRYWTSPEHAWKLAHGIDEVNTNKDHEIMRYYRTHKCFKDVEYKKQSE